MYSLAYHHIRAVRRDTSVRRTDRTFSSRTVRRSSPNCMGHFVEVRTRAETSRPTEVSLSVPNLSWDEVPGFQRSCRCGLGPCSGRIGRKYQ